MYTVLQEGHKVYGIDDGGNRTLLFDGSDRYRNISRRTMLDYKADAQGRMVDIDTLSESIVGGLEKYKDGIESWAERTSLLAEEFILADLLVTVARPLLVAMVDPEGVETETIPDLMRSFNEGHRVYRVDSGSYEGFRQAGFDIVLLCGSDMMAERQLRAATYLLADDGLMLASAYGTRLFGRAIELFIEGAEKHVFDDEHELYRICGRQGLRSWMESMDLSHAYKDACDAVRKCLDRAGAPNVEIEDRLRKIAIRLNRLIKLAQRQWELEMKLEFLDLKEAIQEYMLYQDDKYSSIYRDRLEEIIYQKG